MKVLCLEKRYGNFTFGKEYKVQAFATKGLGKHKQLADFRITDDDGDYYTVAETKDSLEKNWEWIQ